MRPCLNQVRVGSLVDHHHLDPTRLGGSLINMDQIASAGDVFPIIHYSAGERWSAGGAGSLGAGQQSLSISYTLHNIDTRGMHDWSAFQSPCKRHGGSWKGTIAIPWHLCRTSIPDRATTLEAGHGHTNKSTASSFELSGIFPGSSQPQRCHPHTLIRAAVLRLRNRTRRTLLHTRSVAVIQYTPTEPEQNLQ